MSKSPAVHGPLSEPLRTHARADTWFRLRSPSGVPDQVRELARRELELAAEGLWAAPGPALDAGVLYARSALEKVRMLTRLLRGGLDRDVRRRLGRRLRGVHRDLQRARDVGTLEEVVERLRQGTRETQLRDGLTLLGGRLTERRFRESAKRWNGERADELRRRLERIRDESVEVEIDGDGFPLLEPGIRRLHRRAGRELERIRGGRDSARRHRRLMRRCRDLGYALRLLEPAWPSLLCTVGHDVDRITGRLREADHLDALMGRLAEDEALRDGLPAELVGRFEVLRDRFRTEALNVARRVLADDAPTFRARAAVWWTVWEEEAGPSSDG